MRDFNVKKVEITADKIPDDIKVLVVIHPKGRPTTCSICSTSLFCAAEN